MVLGTVQALCLVNTMSRLIRWVSDQKCKSQTSHADLTLHNYCGRKTRGRLDSVCPLEKVHTALSMCREKEGVRASGEGTCVASWVLLGEARPPGSCCVRPGFPTEGRRVEKQSGGWGESWEQGGGHAIVPKTNMTASKGTNCNFLSQYRFQCKSDNRKAKRRFFCVNNLHGHECVGRSDTHPAMNAR